MKNGLIQLAVVAVLGVCGCIKNHDAASPTTDESREYTKMSDVEGTAKVGSVDTNTRSITLTPPHGRTQTYRVSDNVRNLEKLRVGDQVLVHYHQIVEFEVRQPTPEELALNSEKHDVSRIPLAGGAKALQRRGVRVVTIESIDKGHGRMTVRNDDGQYATLEVRYPVSLLGAKAGQTAVITSAETIVGEIKRAD